MHLRYEDIGVTIETWPRSEEEFEALYLALFEGVYRLLVRITGSPAEAEDLVQETFLRCYRQRPGKGKPSVRPWLFRVAMNLGYNARRDRRRREARHAEAARESIGARADDPIESIAREEERRRVRQALDRLPPRQSQTLLLRHAGLSYREVAEALELSPGSVGTLLSRAEAAFEKAYRKPAAIPETEDRRDV